MLTLTITVTWYFHWLLTLDPFPVDVGGSDVRTVDKVSRKKERNKERKKELQENCNQKTFVVDFKITSE